MTHIYNGGSGKVQTQGGTNSTGVDVETGTINPPENPARGRFLGFPQVRVRVRGIST